MPLVKPRTTVDCSGLPVYDFSKLFNKEEIGKGAYGAVFTADYPFNGIDGKGQEKVVVKKMLGEDLTRSNKVRMKQGDCQPRMHEFYRGVRGHAPPPPPDKNFRKLDSRNAISCIPWIERN